MLIDGDLSLKSQDGKTVSTGFYQLRQIKAIRRCLHNDVVKSLVNAFEVSRLDYCNGIYANLSGIHLARRQSVLNAAARLIVVVSRFEHITQLLRYRLRWLRCPERMQFKLYVSINQAVNGMAPDYIKELCVPATVTERHLTIRSAVFNTYILILPTRSTDTKFGDRTFRTAGPTAWNSMPVNIRQSASLG